MEFHNLQVYKDVLVSVVEHDFSASRHESIPYRLYVDWAALVIELAKALSPEFVVPPFPPDLVFQTETIPSDGPYSADADYYFLDYVFFELKSENGCGLKISFENGRWGDENPVKMETVGLRGVSSYIYKEAKSPRAEICVWHAEEQLSEIARIISRHQASCRAIWKTQSGNFLIQKNLREIMYIDGGIGLEGGERFDDAAEYFETTASGQVLKKYEPPYPFSIEDEMTTSSIHRVIGDSLYKFYYSHRFLYAAPEVKAELLLSGLELYEGDLPFNEENLFA